MPTTTVIVLRSNGEPYEGASIRLSFVDLEAGGVTQAVLTDAKGVAVVEHRNGGTADVIVNGRRCGKYLLPRLLTIEMLNGSRST